MSGSSALGNGVSILRKAKVITVGNDKTGLNKVRVQFMDDPNKTTVDAEVLTWFAGQKKSGSVSLPHKDDEVLVGLIDGKTTEAVVLGSLFNSTNKPIATVSKKNENLFNVVTRQGHKLILTDSPKVQTLEIKNKDADTGLIIDFNKGTIKLKAKERIVLDVGKASDDRIIIENGKGINSRSLKGKFDFDAKAGAFGVNSKDVQLKAITNMTCEGINTAIKGTTKTDVTSSGMMTVNGGVIKMG